jgi:hypothetical protein
MDTKPNPNQHSPSIASFRFVAKVIISGRSDLVIGNINHYAQSHIDNNPYIIF